MPNAQTRERIAHLVAKENREMEQMEREFDERPSGGAVHVQSHSREGGKVEVADYWRAAPGQGAADIDDDLPKPRNLLDDADNTGDTADSEDTQAGTDDGRPKPANPLPDLPKIEIREDLEGDGHFGTDRKDKYGNKYEHKGMDILAPPGTPVTSPVAGKIEIRDSYKDGSYDNRYKNVWIKTEDGTEYGLFYVTPRDGEGNILVKNGDRVRAGDAIGTVQDRAASEPSGKMKNHVHFEIRDKSGKVMDPTPYIREWQR